MTQLENKFEIIRNQEEHLENEMHQLCRLYRHWLQNKVPENDARRYIKWHYKFRTYERREK